MSSTNQKEWDAIQQSVASLRASVMAVVFGMVGGVGLFVATAWLLIRGGQNVGETLSLLRHFFPGYSVTWGGAFIGLFYGCLAGGVLGYVMARIYNLVASKPTPPS
ncbi:MAG: hypothetical protein AAF566_13945 [Pseudomonadota bacterium]